MRIVVVGILFFFVVSPLSVLAEGERKLSRRQDCRRMTKQIAHYEGTVLKMAKDRGNQSWAQSTSDHVNRLKNRRADRCPEYAEQRKVLARAKKQADDMKKLMVSAAKGAAKYFSGGMY